MLLTCTKLMSFDWYWLMLSKCVFPSAFTTRSLQMRYPSIVLSWPFICIPCLNPWDCPEVWFASSRPSLPWGIIYCRLVTWSRWGRGPERTENQKSGSELLALFSGGWGYTRVLSIIGIWYCEYNQWPRSFEKEKHLFHQKDSKVSKNYPQKSKENNLLKKIVTFKTLEFLPWIPGHGQVQKRTEPKIGSITQKETAAVTLLRPRLGRRFFGRDWKCRKRS